MSIKMIALDLDGTALRSDREFSEKTLKVLNKAIEKNIKIIIATGRAENSLPYSLYGINGLEYVITSNGARVIRINKDKESEIIHKNLIDENCIDEIHKLVKQHDKDIEIFVEGRAYIGKREYEGVLSGIIKSRDKEYIHETRTPIDDIYEMLLEKRAYIENINVNYKSLEEKAEMEKHLKDLSGVKLTSSFPLNNEIGGGSTSKADALRFLMEKFDISRHELMACGDNPNDIEMLELAGIGVAMGNAEEIVKERADYITANNDDDGVAKAIELFAL